MEDWRAVTSALPYPIVAATLEAALLTGAPADHPDEHEGLEAGVALYLTQGERFEGSFCIFAF